jgi:hypothetical protein
MRSLILLSVLVLAGVAASNATATPLPVPAVVIDSGVDFERSDQQQEYAAAAYDGTNWLVVWEDSRGDHSAVWGARVNASGELIDSVNICIADDADERVEPWVAFNGTNYLVVWQDGRNATYDIYGARVSPAGTVLDPNGIGISLSQATAATFSWCGRIRVT